MLINFFGGEEKEIWMIIREECGFKEGCLF